MVERIWITHLQTYSTAKDDTIRAPARTITSKQRCPIKFTRITFVHHNCASDLRRVVPRHATRRKRPACHRPALTKTEDVQPRKRTAHSSQSSVHVHPVSESHGAVGPAWRKTRRVFHVRKRERDSRVIVVASHAGLSFGLICRRRRQLGAVLPMQVLIVRSTAAQRL